MIYRDELLAKDRLDEMLERERPKKKHNSSCYWCGVLQGHHDWCPTLGEKWKAGEQKIEERK